jgi:hypothetical protein
MAAARRPTVKQPVDTAGRWGSGDVDQRFMVDREEERLRTDAVAVVLDGEVEVPASGSGRGPERREARRSDRTVSRP